MNSSSFEAVVASAVLDTTLPAAPARMTALRSALEYFRSPPRTLITEGSFFFALPACLERWRSHLPAPPAPDSCCLLVCAVSVCFVRSSTITGAATELPCCHSRAPPLNVAAPVDLCNSACCAITCAGPCAPKLPCTPLAPPFLPGLGSVSRTRSHRPSTLPLRCPARKRRPIAARHSTCPRSTQGLHPSPADSETDAATAPHCRSPHDLQWRATRVAQFPPSPVAAESTPHAHPQWPIQSASLHQSPLLAAWFRGRSCASSAPQANLRWSSAAFRLRLSRRSRYGLVPSAWSAHRLVRTPQSHRLPSSSARGPVHSRAGLWPQPLHRRCHESTPVPPCSCLHF